MRREQRVGWRALLALAVVAAGCTVDGWVYRRPDAATVDTAPGDTATDIAKTDTGADDVADALDAADVPADLATDAGDASDAVDASDAMDASDAVDARDATADTTDADPSVAPPRLVAPLSTSRVASRQPALRWELPAGTTGARVEVCADRACATVEATLDVTGTAGTLSRDLPPGVHWWRAYGRAATRIGATTSPTWQFVVGSRSAPRQGSWGVTSDFNGDGLWDLVVTAHGARMGAGRVHVFYGRAGGITATPSVTLDATDGGAENFGTSAAAAGDLNGDGYGDLVVGASGASTFIGRAYLYYGRATGLATVPDAILYGMDGMGARFGSAVAGLGDADGDGYGDLVVGALNADRLAGRAHLFRGSRVGIVRPAAVTLAAPDGGEGNFGSTAAAAGDVNGDGLADVVVGARAAMGRAGRAYVYYGQAGGVAARPSVTLAAPDGGAFSVGLAGAVDFNGDGYTDVAVGAERAADDAGRAYVFLGGSAGIAATPGVTFNAPEGPGSSFGVGLASVGDLDGDGFGDLAIGAYSTAEGEGRAYVFRGGATPAVTPAARLSSPEALDGYFGNAIASGGDLDADGRPDLAVGAVAAMALAGRAYVFLGTAGGIGTTSALTLPAPDGVGGNFANTLALR